MSSVYNTKTNIAFLNYLRKIQDNRASNSKYVQAFFQPDILRIINPLYGQLRHDSGEEKKKDDLKTGGYKRKNLKTKIYKEKKTKKPKEPQFVKLNISEVINKKLPEKKDNNLIESKKKQNSILNKLL
jgi:hypothetical protein